MENRVDQGPQEEADAALRPLRAAGAAVSGLREGTLAGEAERSAVIQVASAVEMSLRRILRDHPEVALPVRLRALAPDELGSDEVLAELRQHDRISIELAAAVHDLLELRRRLREGAPVAPGDGALAQRVAGRLEREALRAPSRPLAPGAAPPATAPSGDEPVAPAPAGSDGSRGRGRVWAAAAAGLLLLLLPLGLWLSGRGDDAEMQQGIALFRSGAYADAAAHFFRYAESHPDDATPHLYLARIHRRLERYDLAVPELRTALELAPDDAAVHTELGLLLNDTGRHDAAVTRLREAIRLDPEMEVAWVGLVRALRADGRADAAEAVLEQAPDEVRALLGGPARDVAPPP